MTCTYRGSTFNRSTGLLDTASLGRPIAAELGSETAERVGSVHASDIDSAKWLEKHKSQSNGSLLEKTKFSSDERQNAGGPSVERRVGEAVQCAGQPRDVPVHQVQRVQAPTAGAAEAQDHGEGTREPQRKDRE